MARRRSNKSEMRTIVLVDAVSYTQELKTYGRALIAPKIIRLKEFVEFFFVYKLRGEFIGQMGDGFLVLCPPTPAEIISESLECQSFIAAYNHRKDPPELLNARIAIHYGLIAPPEQGNYIDTNLNLTARLEGATPPGSICVSAVLHDIVADVLRGYEFEELESDFKGLGQNKYFIVSNTSERASEPTRREARFSFYLSTINALAEAENWEAVKDACEQGLVDFPDNPEFLSQLGFSYYQLDDYLSSIRTYEQCVQMGYEVSDSLLFIARALVASGQDGRALEILDECIKQEPEPFHAMADVAEIYLERGDYDLASKWAKKSLKVNRKFVIPVAILIVVALVTKVGAVESIIRKIEVDRRHYLKEVVKDLLEHLGKTGFARKVTLAFKHPHGNSRSIDQADT